MSEIAVRPRRVFLFALAGFFLLGAAWAVALPVNGTYDEKHHIVRAYAYAAGEWVPGGWASDGSGVFDAPASLLPERVDCPRTDRQPASCQVPVTSRAGTRLPSAAARYSPVYYLPVGVPMLVSPDRAGIVAGRLVSALLSALLLAAAATVAAVRGGWLLLAGVVLVVTPMTMNLAGSINPNGLEIAAGVLLFTVLLTLVRGPDPGEDPHGSRRLLWVGGVAGLLLLTVRQLGPLLCAVDVLACLAVARPGRAGALWRRHDTRWIMGGLGVAGLAFFIGWLAVSGLGVVNPIPDNAQAQWSTGELLRQIATVRVPFYLQQLVGQFGYGETTISKYAIVAWYALWAVVVAPALLTAGTRIRLVLLALAGFCAVLLVGLELRYAPTIGWSQHGRYVLPVAVGIVLIAATSPAAPGWSGRLLGSGWVRIGLAAVPVPVHGYALARVMTRYQVGIDAPLNPLHGSWLPPGGPPLALSLASAGAVLLAGLVVAAGWRPSTTNPAAH